MKLGETYPMIAKMTMSCAAVAACSVLEAPGPSKYQNTNQTDPQWRHDCFPDMRKITTFAIDDRRDQTEKAQKQRKQDFKTDPPPRINQPKQVAIGAFVANRMFVRQGSSRRIAANRKNHP